MNKIIFGAIIGIVLLVGIFSYFLLTEDKTLDDIEIDDISVSEEPKNIISEKPITEQPDKIIKVDYNEIKKECEITKCTARGCSCVGE